MNISVSIFIKKCSGGYQYNVCRFGATGMNGLNKYTSQKALDQQGCKVLTICFEK